MKSSVTRRFAYTNFLFFQPWHFLVAQKLGISKIMVVMRMIKLWMFQTNLKRRFRYNIFFTCYPNSSNVRIKQSVQLYPFLIINSFIFDLIYVLKFYDALPFSISWLFRKLLWQYKCLVQHKQFSTEILADVILCFIGSN